MEHNISLSFGEGEVLAGTEVAYTEFKKIRFVDWLDAIIPMLLAIRKEAENVHPEPIDIIGFIQDELEGHSHLYGAIRSDGTLAGFILYNTFQDHHQAGLVQAQSRVCYVLPAFRGLGLFRFLLNTAEQDLKEFGTRRIILGLKEPSLVMAEHGYKRMEFLYSKDFNSQGEVIK